MERRLFVVRCRGSAEGRARRTRRPDRLVRPVPRRGRGVAQGGKTDVALVERNKALIEELDSSQNVNTSSRHSRPFVDSLRCPFGGRIVLRGDPAPMQLADPQLIDKEGVCVECRDDVFTFWLESSSSINALFRSTSATSGFTLRNLQGSVVGRAEPTDLDVGSACVALSETTASDNEQSAFRLATDQLDAGFYTLTVSGPTAEIAAEFEKFEPPNDSDSDGLSDIFDQCPQNAEDADGLSTATAVPKPTTIPMGSSILLTIAPATRTRPKPTSTWTASAIRATPWCCVKATPRPSSARLVPM